MPDLDALRALVEAGRITPDCDLGAAGRAREALHRLAPELLAVVEEAKRRLDAGHNDTCDRVRSSVRLCSCGASGLLAATEALDAKLDGGEPAPAPGHRWSGWPGAWCLDCGIEDPREVCVTSAECVCAPGYEGPCKVAVGPCPEPGSRRHDPYSQRAGGAS